MNNALLRGARNKGRTDILYVIIEYLSLPLFEEALVFQDWRILSACKIGWVDFDQSGDLQMIFMSIIHLCMI